MGPGSVTLSVGRDSGHRLPLPLRAFPISPPPHPPPPLTRILPSNPLICAWQSATRDRASSRARVWWQAMSLTWRGEENNQQTTNDERLAKLTRQGAGSKIASWSDMAEGRG